MGIKQLTYLFIGLLFFSAKLAAQEMPEVHRINGQKYYLHVVEKGNTLYGISKLYNISIEEIKSSNEILQTEGLKVNQTLLIPVTKENKKDLGGVVEENSEFITHRVQNKETLFAISKKYDVSLHDLLIANPEVESTGLKANTDIKIPVAKLQPKQEKVLVAAKPDTLKGHIVKKGETLFSLSQQYDVSIHELKEANGGLPFGLKEGMALRIPSRVIPLPDNLADLVPDPDSSKDSASMTDLDLIRIGMLFPFDVTFPDTTKKDFEISEPARVSLHFYQGLKLGFDSLFKSGPVALEVKVYDTGVDTSRIAKWHRQGKLANINAFIGPFYTDQFEYICDSVATGMTPVICPIQKPSKILFKRPMAIKTVPSAKMQLHSLSELLVNEFQDSNLVLVNSNKPIDAEDLEFFKQQVRKAKNIPDTSTETGIKEIKLWDINHETLTMRIGDSGNFVFVVPSSDPVFISRFLSGLHNLYIAHPNDYHFTVIGMESWLRMEEQLDIRFLHNLHVTLPVSNHIDFADYRIVKFMKDFTRIHGYEPSEYAIQGFDLATYLHQQFENNLGDWNLKPESTSYRGLSSSYAFERVSEFSGVENKFISLYRYKNYRFKKMNEWPSQKKK